MKNKNRFKILPWLFVAGFSIPDAATLPLRFSSVPSVEKFPDGAVEWKSTVSCADPGALANISLVFSIDVDLDGVSDGDRDSTLLSSADCDSGQLSLAHTFFPSDPAIVTAELKQGSVILDHGSSLTGEIGSILAIHRFCARPVNGEPEWIEINNASPLRINLNLVRVEGHLLNGGLEPSATLLVGRDSLDLQRWQPAANIFVTSSWSYLRNSGDTLRVTWNNSVVLDSIIYGVARESHEGCASALSEEDVSAASGYGMEVSPLRWNPSDSDLKINVTAPNSATYDLRVYDLDGFALCSVVQNKKGSSETQLSLSQCPGLMNRSGSLLLQLQPDGSPALRKRIRMMNRR